jgi:hypothetical protein
MDTFLPKILHGNQKFCKIFGKNTKFLAKRYPFSILDFGLKRKKKTKKPKNPHSPHENLAFWMELNTPMKILAFCILSFQSSWHFTFCISWPKNFLGFGPLFCRMKLNTVQKFWQKGIHSPFWPQERKKKPSPIL